ncbi:uncharacterized protein LOC144760061 [Lissotriton helveticus]
MERDSSSEEIPSKEDGGSFKQDLSSFITNSVEHAVELNMKRMSKTMENSMLSLMSKVLAQSAGDSRKLEECEQEDDDNEDYDGNDNKVHDTMPQVSEAPGHPFDPGSWVLVKNFQRTKNDQPRWTGPHLVLLSTRSAVRVEGKKNWIHGSHCKRVPLPLPYDRWVQEGIADSETETVPRFLPFSDERVKGTNSERESDNLLQGAVPPSIRLNTTEPEILFQDQTLPGKSRYNLRPRVMDK